jgi:AraC family transcriptional regulator
MDYRKQQLESEYRSRVNRVMDHIQAHLDEALTLEDLAGVACFSPYHFHRIFSALVGETLGDHIRRVRLERAAGMLRGNPYHPVTEIALGCGFSSSAAFARAFKAHFGMNATGWRRGEGRPDRNPGKTLRKPGKTGRKGRKDVLPSGEYNRLVHQPSTHQKRRKAMKVEIKELSSFHVAYMRHIGPYGPAVSRLWEKFNRWAEARDLQPKGAVSLGISHDDPSITPPEKCRYDACVVVPPELKPEPGINLTDLPGGKYAVTHFKGTDRDIGKAWNDLFRSWLPTSGYQPDDRPCFELYVSSGKKDCPPGGVFQCDICVPVRPL